MPRVVFSLKGRGQVRAEIEAGNVKSDPEDAALPYELFSGDQTGLTIRWNLLFTYRITGHVMTTLSYRGRQEPWRERLYQTGQVEVRAFF